MSSSVRHKFLTYSLVQKLDTLARKEAPLAESGSITSGGLLMTSSDFVRLPRSTFLHFLLYFTLVERVEVGFCFARAGRASAYTTITTNGHQSNQKKKKKPNNFYFFSIVKNYVKHTYGLGWVTKQNKTKTQVPFFDLLKVCRKWVVVRNIVYHLIMGMAVLKLKKKTIVNFFDVIKETIVHD